MKNQKFKSNKFIQWILNPRSDLFIFVIVLLLVNLVSSRAFLRFDLTKEKSYSLSPASKEVVRTLDEPLSVKIFFSKNLPAPYDSIEQYISDIMVEYKNAASRNFSYERYNMEKKENQNLAQDFGVYPTQVQVFKDNQATAEKAYMGLVITYADQIETLNPIGSIAGLEYTLTSTISGIVSNTNILAGLKENLKLTLYRSSALADVGIDGFNEIDQYVGSSVSEVNKKFKDKIDFEILDPKDSEVMELYEKYGVQVLTWRDDQSVEHQAALDLVLELGEKSRVIPIQLAQTFFGTWMITGVENLSEDLENYVKQIVAKTSAIAYVSGHGELDLHDTQDQSAVYFASLLKDTYTVENLDLREQEIPSYVQSIIIDGPREQFAADELYKIDQFLMKGGNLILFMDPFDEEMQNAYFGYGAPVYTPVETGLEDQLKKYGIALNTEYVFDESCFTEMDSQYGKLNFYYAPAIQSKQLPKKNVITNNLGYILFAQAGSIDAEEAKANSQLKVTELIRSSEKSWTENQNIYLSPLMMTPPPVFEGPKTMALLVEGKFNSAFDAAPAKVDEENESTVSDVQSNITLSSHLSRSTAEGKIFVASSSVITSQQLLTENSREPIAYFLRNVVDYMNGKEDFCTMRTKGLSLNSLKAQKGPGVTFAKYFNEIGLALLVAISGLLVLLSRRAHRKEIRMKYDPDNSRETNPQEKKNGGNTK